MTLSNLNWKSFDDLKLTRILGTRVPHSKINKHNMYIFTGEQFAVNDLFDIDNLKSQCIWKCTILDVLNDVDCPLYNKELSLERQYTYFFIKKFEEILVHYAKNTNQYLVVQLGPVHIKLSNVMYPNDYVAGITEIICYHNIFMKK